MTTMKSSSQLWDEVSAIEALPEEQRDMNLLAALVEMAKATEAYHQARLRVERSKVRK